MRLLGRRKERPRKLYVSLAHPGEPDADVGPVPLYPGQSIKYSSDAGTDAHLELTLSDDGRSVRLVLFKMFSHTDRETMERFLRHIRRVGDG